MISDTIEVRSATDPKHLQKAGGFALKRIVATEGLLLGAVKAAIEMSPPKTAETAGLALLKVLPGQFFEEAQSATGVGKQELAPILVEQLRRVSIFTKLDGGQIEDNIAAAENLIRGGRVELFSR